MKMNLPLYLMEYPIQPEHIKADVLFQVAEEIVLLCQRKGGWYPFAVSELMGITSYQLRQIRGLILINNRFHLSHEFVSTILLFASAVDGKERDRLMVRAHQKAVNTVFYQTWHHIPEMIAIVSFLLAGFVINVWHTLSIGEAVAQMVLWPMGAYKVMTLIVWLGLIGLGLVWVGRQQKNVCLTPMLDWYARRRAENKSMLNWRRWGRGFHS